MPRLHHDGYPPLTCSQACHRARGSLGGEDWALRVGEPIRAPFDGTFRYHRAGTGGYTFTGIPADARLRGMVTQAMHNSRANGLVLEGRAKFFREGHVLGWSGGAIGHPGSGQSTGPHTHQHGILNGIRIAMTAAVAWMLSRTPQPSLDEEYPIMKPEVFHSPTRHCAVAPWLVDGHYLIPGRLVLAAERTWEKGSGSSDPVTERELDDIIELAKITARQYTATQVGGSTGAVPVLEITGTITPKGNR